MSKINKTREVIINSLKPFKKYINFFFDFYNIYI